MLEIEKAFESEFDYVAEFRNLVAVRENMLRKFGSKVRVPKVVPEVVSRRVLGMELFEG